MPSRFVDTNGLRPARSMTYENRRRQEINRQIEQALDESDVLLASIETFHLPGKHNQATHGKGGAKVVSSGDASAVHEAGQAHFNESATPEMKNARLFYMGGVGYDNMNGGLRGTRSSIDAHTQTSIDDLDAAFASASVTSDQPIVVRRGVNRWSGLDTSRGSELTDDGYMSTSSNDWAYNQGDTVLELTVPPGVPMVAADDRWGELILPRGTTIRFTSDEPTQGPGFFPKPVYHAEVVVDG